MTKRHGRAKWELLVRRWRASGRPAKVFAEAHGVRAGTLKWWAWKLGQQTRAPTMTFVPVELSGPRHVEQHAVEIEVAGVHVRIPVGADVAYVATLVRALSASA